MPPFQLLHHASVQPHRYVPTHPVLPLRLQHQEELSTNAADVKHVDVKYVASNHLQQFRKGTCWSAGDQAAAAAVLHPRACPPGSRHPQHCPPEAITRPSDLAQQAMRYFSSLEVRAAIENSDAT